MGKILSSIERAVLISRHRTERDSHGRDRIKAVLAYDEGHKPAEIASILLIDIRTVYRYLKEYDEAEKLRHAHKGKLSKLDENQGQELIAHLRDKVYLYVKEIKAYVLEHYQIHYTVAGLTKWLHANGFVYKKPQAVPAKLNSKEQGVFIEDYAQLKAQAARENEVVLFGDSVHPQHQTQLAYGWIEKGVRKALPTTARQYRLSFMGAIDLTNHKVISLESERVNTESIKAFLKEVSNAYPLVNRIHLILDNAGYHKSKDMIAFAESLRIKIHYLPPYSPNLNPIERLWKIMREVTMYNKYYAKFNDFTEAIRGFFSSIKTYQLTIQSRITDNFQLLDSTLLTNLS